MAQRVRHISGMFCLSLLLDGKLPLLFGHVAGFGCMVCGFLCPLLLFFRPEAHLLGHAHLEYGFFALFLRDVLLLVGDVFHLLADALYHV